ncbi:MAG: CehA/McbA family metallohydrolase, partial [Planctomycetes bacterium]|nr:CehA/McbA family metallohydrolase [Planctomycetota bacterium]
NLEKSDELESKAYSIPARAVHAGANELVFRTTSPADDITLGNIRLHPQSRAEYWNLGVLEIEVRKGFQGPKIPCRLTIFDRQGELAPLFGAESETTAIRPGVAYPLDGTCALEIPAGRYQVWASHGPEWGARSAEIVVHEGRRALLKMNIEPEVDTAGYVAADTHIHTLTFSGHGDSSIYERQVTLAGEGVEFPVATDHNHNIDYRSYQQELGLSEYYTSVVGNEVSTPIGHFNAFPLDPEGPVPVHGGYKTEVPEDWSRLVNEIRGKGAEVVILNHPRWPSFEDSPFGHLQLNRETGERLRDTPFDFDAIEIVNSTTPQTAIDDLLVDWFALLNRGERIVGVGSSDSHTVGDRVGEGRTYVVSQTDVPSQISAVEMATNMREGRTSMSLGLFLEVRHDGAPAMGETVKVGEELQLRLASASWAHAESVTAYINGEEWMEFSVDFSEDPTDKTWTLKIPPQAAGGYLVFVARGPNPTVPFYTTLMASLFAITNPVWCASS